MLYFKLNLDHHSNCLSLVSYISFHCQQPAISSPGSSSSISALTNGSSSTTGNFTHSSPLNRLQNMQPFDYRKAAAAAAAAAAADAAAKGDIERPIPPTMHPGLRMPAGAAAMAGLAAAAGMPLLPTVSGVSPSLAASYQNTIASMASKVRKHIAKKRSICIFRLDR